MSEVVDKLRTLHSEMLLRDMDLELPPGTIDPAAVADYIAELETVLEELADLVDDMREGHYNPDSFTTQPARRVLRKGYDGQWLKA